MKLESAIWALVIFAILTWKDYQVDKAIQKAIEQHERIRHARS